MGMKELEKVIIEELKETVCNPKLKVKDLLEWSTGNISPQEGEVLITLPKTGVNVCIKKEQDKRTA